MCVHAGGRAVVIVIVTLQSACVLALRSSPSTLVVTPQRVSMLALGSSPLLSPSTLVMAMVMVMPQGACMHAGVVPIIVVDAGNGVVAVNKWWWWWLTHGGGSCCCWA